MLETRIAVMFVARSRKPEAILRDGRSAEGAALLMGQGLGNIAGRCKAWGADKPDRECSGTCGDGASNFFKSRARSPLQGFLLYALRHHHDQDADQRDRGRCRLWYTTPLRDGALGARGSVLEL